MPYSHIWVAFKFGLKLNFKEYSHILVAFKFGLKIKFQRNIRNFLHKVQPMTSWIQNVLQVSTIVNTIYWLNCTREFLWRQCIEFQKTKRQTVLNKAYLTAKVHNISSVWVQNKVLKRGIRYSLHWRRYWWQRSPQYLLLRVFWI